MVKTLQGLKQLNDAYSSFLKQENIIDDELQELIKFIKDAHEEVGSIYEFDLHSNLICDLIERICDGENKKSPVLILDDLDRLDPEHIFRILNVISAHIDEESNTNKFNFDHIIIVADQNNIRRIFEHRYGQQVDFNGYFSKFLSSEGYYFNIQKIVSDKIESFLKSIKVNHCMRASETGRGSLYDLANENSPLVLSIGIFLEQLILKRHLTIRTLTQFHGKTFSQKEYLIHIDENRFSSTNAEKSIFFFIDFFCWLLGDMDKLRHLFKTIRITDMKTSFGFDCAKYFIEQILNVYTISKPASVKEELDTETHVIQYEIYENRSNDRFETKLLEIFPKTDEHFYFDYSKFLSESLYRWQTQNNISIA